MTILALDLGTHTGWAIAAPTFGGSLEYHMTESGVQVFDVKRGESPGMRYLRFRRWIEDVTPPDCRLICYEQTHNRGGAATEIAAGLATRVQEICALRAIEHAAVHSATLKKATTGKGNADKAAMLAAVAQKWKAVESDDEADAIALLHYALAELLPSRA